jgi:hypothetical protein
MIALNACEIVFTVLFTAFVVLSSAEFTVPAMLISFAAFAGFTSEETVTAPVVP